MCHTFLTLDSHQYHMGFVLRTNLLSFLHFFWVQSCVLVFILITCPFCCLFFPCPSSLDFEAQNNQTYLQCWTDPCVMWKPFDFAGFLSPCTMCSGLSSVLFLGRKLFGTKKVGFKKVCFSKVLVFPICGLKVMKKMGSLLFRVLTEKPTSTRDRKNKLYYYNCCDKL